MKTMHGAFFLACSNMSRTRLAPTPTNISTKSEPESGEERNARFTRDGTGQQGLPGTGRTDQQRALGDLPAKLGEPLRIAQELDDFLQFLARFVDAGHVVESDLARTFGQQLGLGLAEAHRAAAAALLHLAQSEEGDAEDQQERQRIEQDIQQHIWLFSLATGELHPVVFHQPGDLDVIGHRNGREGFPVLERAGDQLVAKLHVLHFTLDHCIAEVGITDRSARALPGIAEKGDDQQQGEEYPAPDHQLPDPGVGSVRLLLGIVLVAHRLDSFLTGTM